MSCFVGLRILCLLGYRDSKVGLLFSVRYKIPILYKIKDLCANRKNNSI